MLLAPTSCTRARVAVDILERMPGNTMPRQPGNHLEVAHTADERIEAFQQRMVDFEDSGDATVLFGVRGPTGKEIAAAMDVTEIFRSCLVGPNGARDFKILVALARRRSSRKIAREHHISQPNIQT